MENILIGGFLALIGSIWALAIIFLAARHLTSEGAMLPKRLLTAISKLGMSLLFVISMSFVVFGIVFLLLELEY